MLLFQGNPLNENELIFPTLEVIHILGFAFSVGTIALVDFRMLGLGMKKQTAAEVASDLSLWTLVGLVTMVISGLLLFSSDPDMYYLNRSFQIKMVLLVAAIVFHYTVHRKSVAVGGSTAVAAVSLALWTGVVFGGIFIAFI